MPPTPQPSQWFTAPITGSLFTSPSTVTSRLTSIRSRANATKNSTSEITGVSSGASTFWTMVSASTTALSLRTAEMERSQASTMDARNASGRKPAYRWAMPSRLTAPPAAILAAIWSRKLPARKRSNTCPAAQPEKALAPNRLMRLPVSCTTEARKPLRAYRTASTSQTTVHRISKINDGFLNIRLTLFRTGSPSQSRLPSCQLPQRGRQRF